MKTNFFENKNVGVSMTIVAILLLFLGGFFLIKNYSLKNQLTGYKIQNESLVAENLLATKSAEKLNSEKQKLQNQNNTLTGNLDATNSKIASKEAEIKKLKSQNANVSVLNKKVKELESLKADQESQLSELNQNVDLLKQKNNELSALLDEAQKKNTLLMQNNQILISMEGNNYKTEALRGKKEKLTAKAACTKRIVVSLDVPVEAAPNISFAVKTPGGKEFSSANDKALSVKTIGNSGATPLKMNGETINMSKIELSFIRDKRLEKGVYSFDIYNKEVYSGTTLVRLK